jgi:uncharacterized protein (DUF427 family)
MAVQMSSLFWSVLPELRIHPVDKWIRAYVGDAVIVSSRRARLVWEPRRVVPSYAVPTADVDGELRAYTGGSGTEHAVRMGDTGPPVLDPRTAFTVHSCPGKPLTVSTRHGDLRGAAFAPDDPDMADYVVLDWEAFSQWHEEDEQVMGHPHDPFDRIDCLASSRHIVVSAHGTVLAQTSRATMLFETPLPVRYYIPREDVRMDLLTRSELETVCAYKGVASYWSAQVGDQLIADVAWSYERPLHDAQPVAGNIAFFTEHLDLEVDGVRLDRPVTPWS